MELGRVISAGMETHATNLPTARESRLGRKRLKQLLAAVSSEDADLGVTAYVSAGSPEESLRERLELDGKNTERLERLQAFTRGSATGAAVFWSETRVLAVLPPFPLERDQVLARWDTGPLDALLSKDYMVGVVLLRLGRFSVGVFRGETLLSAKSDTRYVKGRHSAGGTSQKRFERIRDKQIYEIYRKTCSVVEDKFSPYEGQLDYILLGGEQFTLRGLLKQCDYLQKLSHRIVGRTLNVRTPNRDALEKVIATIWESRVLSME